MGPEQTHLSEQPQSSSPWFYSWIRLHKWTTCCPGSAVVTNNLPLSFSPPANINSQPLFLDPISRFFPAKNFLRQKTIIFSPLFATISSPQFWYKYSNWIVSCHQFIHASNGINIPL